MTGPRAQGSHCLEELLADRAPEGPKPGDKKSQQFFYEPGTSGVGEVVCLFAFKFRMALN